MRSAEVVLEEHAAQFGIAHINIVGPLHPGLDADCPQGTLHGHGLRLGEDELARGGDALRLEADAKKQVLPCLGLPVVAALTATGGLVVGRDQEKPADAFFFRRLAQVEHGGVGLQQMAVEPAGG